MLSYISCLDLDGWDVLCVFNGHSMHWGSKKLTTSSTFLKSWHHLFNEKSHIHFQRSGNGGAHFSLNHDSWDVTVGKEDQIVYNWNLFKQGCLFDRCFLFKQNIPNVYDITIFHVICMWVCNMSGNKHPPSTSQFSGCILHRRFHMWPLELVMACLQVWPLPHGDH